MRRRTLSLDIFIRALDSCFYGHVYSRSHLCLVSLLSDSCSQPHPHASLLCCVPTNMWNIAPFPSWENCTDEARGCSAGFSKGTWGRVSTSEQGKQLQSTQLQQPGMASSYLAPTSLLPSLLCFPSPPNLCYFLFKAIQSSHRSSPQGLIYPLKVILHRTGGPQLTMVRRTIFWIYHLAKAICI